MKKKSSFSPQSQRKEAIFAEGPFVMNSMLEIGDAYKDFFITAMQPPPHFYLVFYNEKQNFAVTRIYKSNGQ